MTPPRIGTGIGEESYPRRVNRERINAAIAQERRRIADLIDGLDEAQLTTETLCTGWDVKTMGAHLVMPLENGIFESFILSLRRQHGSGIG